MEEYINPMGVMYSWFMLAELAGRRLGLTVLSANSVVEMHPQSDVWTVFEQIKDRKKGRCQLYSRELSWHGGTSLRKHIESCHALEFKKMRERSESTREGDVKP